LIRNDWRPEETAEMLSVSRSTVYRKMKKYGFLKR
jgi:transcriptional regulator of acetoin/glycerol metabolism